MIDNYVLYKDLPSIDLHGYNRFTAVMLVKDFINDNKKLKNKLMVVIHGKGEYTLKNSIHEMLKHNKDVKEFRIDMYNDGVTIVELK